jgi:predicted amino acid-binding ACT domain protein
MRQQVLRGYFSMILYVSFPADVTADEISRRLAAAGTSDAAVEISIKEVRQQLEHQQTQEDNCYVLTADGEDRIGFVATVTKFCKENGINILDLTTTVARGRYTMILFVDLSNCVSMAEVHQNLEQFAEATDLNMVLQHNDIFKATNEIKIF